MTGLWIIATLMTVATLGALMFPLMRGRKFNTTRRGDFDITVYKDQLVEVDRDLERGLLSATQAQSARTEIERRMLAVMGEPGSEKDEIDNSKNTATMTGATNPGGVMLMIGVLAIVPLGAFGAYLNLGNPSMPDQPLAARAKQLNEATEGRAQVAEMVAKLERQMEETPDDPNGWALLARSYQAMGRFEDGVNALKNLAILTDNDPEALVMLAEMLVEMDRGSVSLQAVKVLNKVKSVDPLDPRPYFYLGLERQQKGDFQGAVNEWAALLNNSPSNAGWVPEMQQRIASLVEKDGVESPKIVLLAPMAEVPNQSSDAPAPSTEQMQDAAQMSNGDQQAMIRSMVERLATRLNENPDDLDGWIRLERAYRVLGETAKAENAEREIARLKK